ncbi:MAG: polymer-forming cytoskeletal protein [Magnetovibrio sp.]|nr:polymer-forming cytoskeletal protein [Magnetovibrio sp.]
MFSKNKKDKQAQNNQPRAVPSIISADLKIVGDLSSAGEIQVDGEVTGDIRSKVLLVGETASIKGEIRAETVRVHGHINGQIRATYVNLAKSAHVVGDILHENLSIQEGAFLEGHLTHMSEKQLKESGLKPFEEAVKLSDDRVNLVVKTGAQAAPKAQDKATVAAKTAPAQSPVQPKTASGS